MSDAFAIDWHSREAVIAYANKLGGGRTVFKHPDRRYYNITHTSEKSRYHSDWVVHQTPLPLDYDYGMGIPHHLTRKR